MYGKNTLLLIGRVALTDKPGVLSVTFRSFAGFFMNLSFPIGLAIICRQQTTVAAAYYLYSTYLLSLVTDTSYIIILIDNNSNKWKW